MKQNRENAGLLMEQRLRQLGESGRRPKLLLHACCAPCSSYVLEYIARHFDLTLYFYNPNIAPVEEFTHRAEELFRFVKEAGYGDVTVDVPPHDGEAFDAMAAGREDLPEGGARCYDCYRLRLEKTAQRAKAEGFDCFTTTLSISPHKNADWLNEIGREMAARYGVEYLAADFKKKDGYKRSIALSREYGLYRQDYCGCRFSKAAAEKRAEERKNTAE